MQNEKRSKFKNEKRESVKSRFPHLLKENAMSIFLSVLFFISLCFLSFRLGVSSERKKQFERECSAVKRANSIRASVYDWNDLLSKDEQHNRDAK
jgi:hypothetical protein